MKYIVDYWGVIHSLALFETLPKEEQDYLRTGRS
jgi:hypothetical protein